MTATATATAAPSAADAVRTGSLELARLLGQLERPDLVGRVTAAAARLQRPSTIVAVVGEFKQGKSSLVNGLLGQPVCPVDDDLATSAITLVRHGEQPGAVVRRNGGDGDKGGPIPIDTLHDWVSERGNPGNRKGVERVEITAPSAILAQGLVLVDTPGMGGLGAGHAAATLAFLPFADGLILVSDASSELSAPEIDFLRRAVELCPTVMFAQTKIDLYPEWERIVNLNRGHLERAGVRIPIVAVSSHLRSVALARKDRSLNDASRFPELITHLGNEVVTPAKESAAARSAHDVQGVVRLVRSGLEQERQLLDDPSAVAGAVAAIEQANARIEHLRGPGARWSVLVNDRISDLTTSVTHALRSGMRDISREMDERVEVLKKGDEWDEVTRHLQTRVADEVTRAFVAVEQGDRSIRAEAIELLAEEQLDLGASRATAGRRIDVTSMWREKSLDGDERGLKANLKTGLTGARGAQGGVMMFGMMGSFLPGAAAVMIASNPVLLGAGALFGGMQIIEDRKRKVAQRRQSARQQVRQFIDDVQFEVTNELSGLIRQAHREIRDGLTSRLAELQRTYMSAAQRAQADAKQTQEQQAGRKAALDQQLAALTKIAQIVEGGAR
jgi:hypothetical protein